VDKMLTASEYYRDVYAKICYNFTHFMEFAEYYAGYVYAHNQVSSRKNQEKADA